MFANLYAAHYVIKGKSRKFFFGAKKGLNPKGYTIQGVHTERALIRPRSSREVSTLDFVSVSHQHPPWH